jgi:hypothetical protein
MFFFPPEMKLGSEIMRKILNFASFESKKFSPSFCYEAKIIKSKRSEKFKAKKNEKKGKKAKKKQKNRLEFCFASFCFETKITKAKRKIRSENKGKREVKIYSGFISLISEKIFLSETCAP